MTYKGRGVTLEPHDYALEGWEGANPKTHTIYGSIREGEYPRTPTTRSTGPIGPKQIPMGKGNALLALQQGGNDLMTIPGDHMGGI
jgi:hypothetical protein